MEYTSGTEHINALSTSSWQSTSIFLAATLAGIAFVAQLEPNSASDIAITWVISVGAAILLSVWMLMVRRFVYFQRIEQLRLAELETQLGFRRTRYLEIIERWEERESLSLWSELAEPEKRDLSDLRERLLAAPLFGYFGVRLGYAHTATLTYVVGLLVGLGWIAVAVIQTVRYANGDFEASVIPPSVSSIFQS